jgi:hypothetical protein
MAKFIIAFIALIIISVPNTFAQCALCTKTAQGFNPEAAKGVNAAILYLAFIPLGMLIAVFIYMYKSNKANGIFAKS